MSRTRRYASVRMATMRTYGDGCAIAVALDLVGERWALLVVRELLLGPKRYTDLRRGLPNASPNVLSERLRELERAGVVRRRKLPPPAGARVYELTDWGRELEEIVISLGHWAARSPAGLTGGPVGADSTILALRSRFDPGAAHGLRAVYELRLGEDRFRIDVADEEIEVARGGADHADATIDTDPDTLAAVLWAGRPLADAQRSGDLTIQGDAAAVERFVRLFPLPEPAAAVSAT
jgi:DNA-binding HxlR family transcriptional regulator